MSIFGMRALNTLSIIVSVVATSAQAREWSYVIEPKYDFAESFSEGFAVVGFDHEFTRDEGYVDANGQLLGGGVPYTMARPFKNGYAIVEGHRYPSVTNAYLIDRNNRTVMIPKWEPNTASDKNCQVIGYRLEGEFSHGLIPVQVMFSNNSDCEFKNGYADENGRVMFLEYNQTKSFSEGVAVVQPESGGGYHLIDRLGNKISPLFERLEASSENLSVACSSGLCGLLNSDGTYFKRLIYDDLRSFSENRAAFKINGKWGYLSRSGEVVIAERFKEANDFHEGLAAVTTFDGVSGYIDLQGNWAFKLSGAARPSYNLHPFSEGYAAVKIDGRYGYVDKTGTLVVPTQFGDAGDFHEGLAPVKIGSSDYLGYGEWGFIRITK